MTESPLGQLSAGQHTHTRNPELSLLVNLRAYLRQRGFEEGFQGTACHTNSGDLVKPWLNGLYDLVKRELSCGMEMAWGYQLLLPKQSG